MYSTAADSHQYRPIVAAHPFTDYSVLVLIFTLLKCLKVQLAIHVTDRFLSVEGRV